MRLFLSELPLLLCTAFFIIIFLYNTLGWGNNIRAATDAFSANLVEPFTEEGGNGESAPSKKKSSNTSYSPYTSAGQEDELRILEQKNAGNIEYLKERLGDVEQIKGDVSTLKQNMELMQTQIDGLVQQQADYAQELAGSSPPAVSGTEV